MIGTTLAKSDYEDDQPLEAESEAATGAGAGDEYDPETEYAGASVTPTEAGAGAYASTGAIVTATSSPSAGETSRNPYKWDEEGRASATSAWAGSETTDLADRVSSLAKEGRSSPPSLTMLTMMKVKC